MTKVTWGEVGSRFYESGIDRGVLYLSNQPAVAWNGLTSVKETVSGGEAIPYYLDGIKYLQLSATEDFQATIEAFSAPVEFNACDGLASLVTGLFAAQQPRSKFGMSYRTKIGNDTDGPDYGYKLHLIYNALAAPSERNRATTNDNVSPTTLSWGISTVPVPISGSKPSAHLIVDTRLLSPEALYDVEDFLYGSDATDGKLPTPTELVSLITGS